MEIPLSIVITTYSREIELRRCLSSILAQDYSNYEIIIVDDHTLNSYEEKIKYDFPQVRYFYQEKNQGPGPARNKGILEARNNYVIIMDDDDVFTKDAFKKISAFLYENKGKELPFFGFLRSNALLQKNKYFQIMDFKDLISGSLVGDITPVINKEIFCDKENYFFPHSRIGAELLLWFRIAIDYGYPIVNEVVVSLLEDASIRLTNIEYQIKKANLFKDYQKDIINNFENDIFATKNIEFLLSKYRGVVIYSLLDSDYYTATKYLKNSIQYSKKQILLIPLLLTPKFLLEKIFIQYRRKNYRL